VSDLFSFDAGRAYEHTQKLCYPRRAGTPGERQAARSILHEFTLAGLEGQQESFSISLFPTEVGNRLLFLLAALLTCSGALLIPASTLLAALCWSTAAFLTNAPWTLLRFSGKHWPPRLASENLLATLPGTRNSAPARVIFMAHYDTKSQLFPTGARVTLVYLVTVLCLLLALSSLLAAIGFPRVLELMWPGTLSSVVVLALIALATNFNGNRSPGAIDNGSSVGTLLELARVWRPRPEVPVEVLWVATACEETHLDGAREFLHQHGSWWEEKPTLLINLESVGAGRTIYLAGEPRVLELAEAITDELDLPRARLRVLGAGMDHEPFAARGLPALSILGDVVRYSFALHSPRDNMSLIEKPALARAGCLAACLAWRWAELHQPACGRPGSTDEVSTATRPVLVPRGS
jgi:hypothetical protein